MPTHLYQARLAGEHAGQLGAKRRRNRDGDNTKRQNLDPTDRGHGRLSNLEPRRAYETGDRIVNAMIDLLKYELHAHTLGAQHEA